ncbi:MAG: Fmu (Sun) domain-containing protein [Anaerolineaceae bacterium]|nr:MAG: Fmu (Sun) domain-containing protein [Anaerolineaceae bacterium]
MTAPVPIPPLFLDRMSRLLGGEFPAFAAALEGEPVGGLRVNTLKLSAADFGKISPFPLGDAIPWCPSAFIFPLSSFSPGLHPYHLAGLYYLQDPSAMSPAALLDPQPGDRVLDLAAAPGGKTTHLAALMQGGGLLVANEIKDKRVGHLAMNVERWGAGNVVVANETPERLADHFGPYFDRVLVDAPCSGEGMFRKDMGARLDWSPEMVAGCAVRQRNILRVAGKLVRPGGALLYSTCTFAPEENEGVIAEFLREFPEFDVEALPLFEGFERGRPEWLEEKSEKQKAKNKKQKAQESLAGAMRLFPHRVSGEGHFVCLLKRKGAPGADRAGDERMPEMDRARRGLWAAFAADALAADFAADRLKVRGERLYFIPEEMPDFGTLRVVHPGVWFGNFKKERFEPAHPLVLFLRRGQAQHPLNLEPGSPALAAYLRGETLPSGGPAGWTLVTVDGWPLGWGKRVQGVVKNHFPRGWM